MQNQVFKLEVTLENDAFKPTLETCCDELARILRNAAANIATGHSFQRSLFDANGNCVGHTKVISRREP